MLAVTLALDAQAQTAFDAERARWAPGEAARLVLFGALPEQLEARVRTELADAAGPPYPLGVAAVLPLRGGFAYAFASPQLQARCAELQQQWWAELAPADRRPVRPHVVIATGLPDAQARAELAVRRRAFRPRQVYATGFVLWRPGAPWTQLAAIPFDEN